MCDFSIFLSYFTGIQNIPRDFVTFCNCIKINLPFNIMAISWCASCKSNVEHDPFENNNLGTQYAGKFRKPSQLNHKYRNLITSAAVLLKLGGESNSIPEFIIIIRIPRLPFIALRHARRPPPAP